MLSKTRKQSFASDSFFYLLSSIYSSLLSFLFLPFFTRVLTIEQYGLYSIFLTVVNISSIIFNFGTSSSINRFYVEKRNEIFIYLSNVLFIITVLSLVMIIISSFFFSQLSILLNISSRILIIALMVGMFTAFEQQFLSYLQALRLSKKFLIVIIIRTTCIYLISLIGLIGFSENMFEFMIASRLLPMVIIFTVIVVILLMNNKKISIRIEYIKYALIFGAPLILHNVSGFILSSIDKVIINSIDTSVSTGLYSFAYTIGSVMSLVVIALNRAWVPIFYHSLEHDDDNILNEFNKYIVLIEIITIGLLLFSTEFVFLMSGQAAYRDTQSIVRIVIVSYFVVFLYTIYANYSFYFKKTLLISCFTLLAGIVNIFLNLVLIPLYGYQIAASTTLISFLLLFTLHYFYVNLIIKPNILIRLQQLIRPMVIVVLANIFMEYFIIDKWVLNFLTRVVLMLIVIITNFSTLKKFLD